MNLRLARRFSRRLTRTRTWSPRAYALVVLAALAAASISTMAQSFVDTDPALYRCAVLGETRSCRQPASRPTIWYEEWVDLGTNAKYRRDLGANPKEANAKARLLAEEPTRHVVQVTRIALSLEQACERGVGQRIVEDETRRKLSTTAVLEERPLLHNDWSTSLLSMPPKCPAGSLPEGQDADAHPARCVSVASRTK